MSLPARHHRYTFAEYLTVEEMSVVKHEFLDGEIYAMAGGSPLHAALSAAVVTALSMAVRGGSCRVFTSDLRIRVLATGLATYPDVSVVCGPVVPDPEGAASATNPTVVVEVLSDSTMDYDLGEKFEHYKQVPSLKAVIYVWQDQRKIEIRRRAAAESWISAIAEESGSISIDALGCTLAPADLYRDAAPPEA
jgi:Uma2 family endonuclease